MFSDAYYSQKINHLSDNKMDLFVLTDVDFFKKNGPTPASFSFILGLFQTNIITIFTTD